MSERDLNFIMYQTNKIILKPLTKEYINENYLNWFYDEDVIKYTSHFQYPKTIEDLFDYVNNIDNTKVVFAIEALHFEKGEMYGWTSGKSPKHVHVGNISLQEIDYINRSCEIAFLIGNKECWGQGIATTAGMFVLSHAFDKLNMNKVWLGTAQENKGMIKVSEKLGMTMEGRLRQGLFIDGNYQDILRYSILKKEWDKIMEYLESNVK